MSIVLLHEGICNFRDRFILQKVRRAEGFVGIGFKPDLFCRNLRNGIKGCLFVEGVLVQ